MARDPRKFVGFRCSPQGVAYITYVATRDRITFSEALRRLLALGAKHDSEATHGGTGRQPESSPSGSADPGHFGGDESGGDRDLDGDGSGGSVSEVPHTVGEALGVLIGAGFHPERVEPDPAG